jgi:hypothetical protein
MNQEIVLMEEGYPIFIIEIKTLESHMVDFEVCEVLAWSADGKNVVRDKELYLKGCIKWDGCSHVWFGSEDRDGYIHLCGKDSWLKHNEIMTFVWDTCTKLITNFDADEAN